MGISYFGSGFNRFGCGVFGTQLDIIAHGVVKEDGVLGHQSHKPPQGGFGDIPNIDIIQGNPTLICVVKTGHQICDGTFATPGLSHQGHGLSLPDLQVEVLQHGLAIIAEGYTL